MVVNNFPSNDLDKYSLLDHTHSNYVTESQVTTIVSNNIQNGTIEVNSKMFTMVNYYTSSASPSTTVNGSGIITVLSTESTNCYITIDGTKIASLVKGDIFIFKNNFILCGYSGKSVKISVGFFNL